MIVVSNGEELRLIDQHEHGKISGEIAKQMKNDLFLSSKRRPDVEYAISYHDYAWYELDQNPKWNDKTDKPYTFVDYPMQDKLASYERGIDFVQKNSEYAGLLCSLHYSSFFSSDSTNPAIRSFISREMDRRKQIKSRNRDDQNEKMLDFHFKWLQFCDDLSLYLCMNEPGAKKEDEVSWFRNGFRQTFAFAPDGMVAMWKNQQAIYVHPFPFKKMFHVKIPFKILRKQELDDHHLANIYKDEKTFYYKISIQPWAL
ncbi:Protein of unknown function [Salinibacillus kushneri]|uniref:DUF3891 family protein n=1 Tax=Salinibacillus kushneri TaxID=237682 RepID=A0A1I0C2L4_9BACI|nr:DUF3891 family protein [Salinibacillus kushneri]SET13628.1 Protein of unknown function [Salinibacillus kushneri]